MPLTVRTMLRTVRMVSRREFIERRCCTRLLGLVLTNRSFEIRREREKRFTGILNGHGRHSDRLNIDGWTCVDRVLKRIHCALNLGNSSEDRNDNREK